MGFDLQTVAVDSQKLRDGIWWELRRESDGSLGGVVVPAPTAQGCVLVRQRGLAYERAVDKAQQPRVGALAASDTPEEERERIVRAIEAEAIAETVLLDWRNLTIGGADVPFSVDKAAELMRDERWMALREFVQRASLHRASVLEEAQAQGN